MAYSDHFSIANLPYGIASTLSDAHRDGAVVTRLGDTVIFMSDLSLDITARAKAAIGRVRYLSLVSCKTNTNVIYSPH